MLVNGEDAWVCCMSLCCWRLESRVLVALEGACVCLCMLDFDLVLKLDLAILSLILQS